MVGIYQMIQKPFAVFDIVSDFRQTDSCLDCFHLTEKQNNRRVRSTFYIIVRNVD